MFVQVVVIAFNQRPRCTQRDIKLVALQSSGVFDSLAAVINIHASMATWLVARRNKKSAAWFLCGKRRAQIFGRYINFNLNRKR